LAEERPLEIPALGAIRVPVISRLGKLTAEQVDSTLCCSKGGQARPVNRAGNSNGRSLGKPSRFMRPDVPLGTFYQFCIPAHHASVGIGDVGAADQRRSPAGRSRVCPHLVV
jgi:hypothetical protein